MVEKRPRQIEMTQKMMVARGADSNVEERGFCFVHSHEAPVATTRHVPVETVKEGLLRAQ